jgi:hypothetical protein
MHFHIQVFKTILIVGAHSESTAFTSLSTPSSEIRGLMKNCIQRPPNQLKIMCIPTDRRLLSCWIKAIRGYHISSRRCASRLLLCRNKAISRLPSILKGSLVQSGQVLPLTNRDCSQSGSLCFLLLCMRLCGHHAPTAEKQTHRGGHEIGLNWTKPPSNKTSPRNCQPCIFFIRKVACELRWCM